MYLDTERVKRRKTYIELETREAKKKARRKDKESQRVRLERGEKIASNRYKERSKKFKNVSKLKDEKSKDEKIAS